MLLVLVLGAWRGFQLVVHEPHGTSWNLTQRREHRQLCDGGTTVWKQRRFVGVGLRPLFEAHVRRSTTVNSAPSFAVDW